MGTPRPTVIKHSLRGAPALLSLALVIAAPAAAAEPQVVGPDPRVDRTVGSSRTMRMTALEDGDRNGTSYVEQLASLLSNSSSIADARYCIRRIVYATGSGPVASTTEELLLGGTTAE